MTGVLEGRSADPAPLHADATALLTGWTPPDLGQAALREAFLALLAARPDALRRSCAPGHLTASAVVLSADGSRVLLTLHPRVGRWLQLGGHCEDGDATVAEAALREAGEESGLRSLWSSPDPIHLDVHPITCSLGRPTRHFDVRFLIVAPEGAEPVISSESDDLRFFDLAALPPDLDPSVAAALAAALDRFTGSPRVRG